MTLDPVRIRGQFPALTSGAVFFDNPGGTQVSHQVVDRMVDYLVTKNANHGGAFRTSRESDAVLAEARQAAADFVNAARPEEIVFGPNMTTLTLGLSRALARQLAPGDEIIVTRLDHDANIAPWLLVAQDRGCRVHWVDFDVEDCTLRLEQLEAALSAKTRLVAVGYASNAVGTINSVGRIVELAHQAGALCFIDAVQYAPHGPIDVQALGCDFLVVSAYKFFGPHLGMLYGKYEQLDRLQAYKVRPAPDDPPGKFETGTGNHEGIAGTLGALEYLSWLGETFGGEHGEHYGGTFDGRRLLLKQGMSAIRAYEMELSRALLETLAEIPGLRIWGITDLKALDRRVPTVSFTVEGMTPRAIAEALDAAGVYVSDGNYYALAVTERLGREGRGGMVRVGLAHYNTIEEVERLGRALQAIVSG
ncbi:MAG: cysteine desulfurase-like protein [Chloroflexota bacterium]